MSKCIFYEKIYLWIHGFFRFIFVFLNMDVCKKNIIWEWYINGIFENTYTMYEILENCVTDFAITYIDIHKLILFLWKYIFFWIFHFFL